MTQEYRRQKDDLLAQMTREVEEIIAAGEPWTDHEFPAAFESLFEQGNDHERSAQENFTNIEWRRASEIY